MLIVCKHILLTDAEAAEDVLKDAVGGDAAGYVAQVVDALANVLTDEVAGKVLLQAVAGAVDGGSGLAEGLVVASVGHDNGILCEVG